MLKDSKELFHPYLSLPTSTYIILYQYAQRFAFMVILNPIKLTNMILHQNPTLVYLTPKYGVCKPQISTSYFFKLMIISQKNPTYLREDLTAKIEC